MMKYNSLKKYVANKIIAFVEQSLEYDKTRASIKEIEEKMSECRVEMMVNVDKMNAHRKEIDKKISPLLTTEQILNEHVQNLDKIYLSKKQELNDHYYLLQKAFVDYLKSKTTDYVYCRNLDPNEKRIDDLEAKINKLFFEGKDSNKA